MKVTFLIGNGFDLNLGLKTKYSNFIETYCMAKDDDSKLIEEFKNQILEKQDLWSYAELAFGQYIGNFKGENAADDFSACFDDFRTKLASYLTAESKDFNIESTKDKFGPALTMWNEHFREDTKIQIAKAMEHCAEGINYNFICYNYTDVLDRYIKYARTNAKLGERVVQNHAYRNQIGELIHVHGTLKKDMIMGVDNITQLANPGIFDDAAPEYLADIIKVDNNRMCGENMDSKAHALLKSSDFIYIYGMSLGETDATWWRRICEIMSANKNIRLIIYCYDAPSSELLRRTRVTFDNRIKKQFSDFCDYDSNLKEEIEQKIYIQNYNIFQSLAPSK